jgi:hypothetical protein
LGIPLLFAIDPANHRRDRQSRAGAGGTMDDQRFGWRSSTSPHRLSAPDFY